MGQIFYAISCAVFINGIEEKVLRRYIPTGKYGGEMVFHIAVYHWPKVLVAVFINQSENVALQCDEK